ncbi:putative ABC transport system ATP-binding protein [Chitinophaga costaii]|uniref:Putative ABC transport system ATP-binding protein n=1 Tax=Chitinophaga costaii TaxID=1335309 RepID=A0A1C4ACR9_9BACT|nr:ATP-binding cassette domain-containing protein [Chitinophaga costaii]SCB92365.1 putative ABC transport system ATP-binding protein [Chitinophaga costaii]
MTIQLDHLIPVPLRDKVLQQASGVWNQALTWQAGQFVKINAPSGTGKTTLMHYLYNIRYDYTGSISLDGRPWPTFSKNEVAGLRQQQLSVIFQDLRLFDQLTAWENINLKRSMSGDQPFCSEERVQEMAGALQVSHILHQSAKTLSYGERQRIAIIRALVQPFVWLFMDEPFSHLDEVNTARAAQLITEECRHRQAGFVLTDLDTDQHFDYHVHHHL